MIRWLIQTTVDHPGLSAGRPPTGLLTRAELGQFSGFINPRRQRDWLLGRWTAKRLLQMHVAATEGFCPTLDSFTVEQEPNGAPYFASQHLALRGQYEDGRVPIALSISHSNGYAFCTLCGDNGGWVRLGADIEMVEPRPDSFAEDFFTDAEQANLNAAPPALHELLTTATWSAKEAVLKATHLGLRADPRTVQCLLRSAHPRHWTPLRVEMPPAIRLQSESTGSLTAWWRVIDNRLRPGTWFVLTLASYGAMM
jgi:4'-phosphopantetheinyl transferase